jgi:hypothetical protein
VTVKLPDDIKLPDQAAILQFAAHILARIDDGTVIVGPLVFERERDPASLFFMVERSEAGCYRWNILEASREMAPALRECLIVELSERHSLIVYDVGDELAATRLAASLWPNPQIDWILHQLEERLRQEPRLH